MFIKRPCCCGFICGCLLLLAAILLVAHTQYDSSQQQAHQQQSARVAHVVNQLIDDCTDCHANQGSQPALAFALHDVPQYTTTAVLPSSNPAPQDPVKTHMIELGQRMLDLPDLSSQQAKSVVDDYVRVFEQIGPTSDTQDLWQAVWRLEDAVLSLENQAAPVQLASQPATPDQPDVIVHTASTSAPTMAPWTQLAEVNLDTGMPGTLVAEMRLSLPQAITFAAHRRGPPARVTMDSV